MGDFLLLPSDTQGAWRKAAPSTGRKGRRQGRRPHGKEGAFCSSPEARARRVPNLGDASQEEPAPAYQLPRKAVPGVCRLISPSFCESYFLPTVISAWSPVKFLSQHF